MAGYMKITPFPEAIVVVGENVKVADEARVLVLWLRMMRSRPGTKVPVSESAKDVPVVAPVR